MFAAQLRESITSKKSPVVIGLDPDIAKFPPGLQPPAGAGREEMAAAIVAFNKTIIDHTADLAAAIKPQLAFYERYGWQGMRALEETALYAQSKNLPVIMDAKRGDVPNTAAAYAGAYLGSGSAGQAWPCDALTVNPFLGRDSVQPFIDAALSGGRGLFILVRTSNPGSGDLQNLTTREATRPIWQEIAVWVKAWAEQTREGPEYSPLGIVAGLTQPSEAWALRRLLPHSYLLLPGLGAQGGQIADALPCFDRHGLGALLVAARSIIFAFAREPYNNTFAPADFGPAARQALLDNLADLRSAGYPLT